MGEPQCLPGVAGQLEGDGEIVDRHQGVRVVVAEHLLVADEGRLVLHQRVLEPAETAQVTTAAPAHDEGPEVA